MRIITLISCLICCSFSFEITAQTFILDYSIGNFGSASAFSINSSGFIFVTDGSDNSFIKLDTLGKIIKEIGGYGWGESAFDSPVDVFATPLNVFVCDKQNHRIQAFDRSLNFISELYTRERDNLEEQFGYPLSCAFSSMGDLYVLDSENIRILKFDLFGNFILNFGGFDAGIYSLKNPKKLAVNIDNSILVLDDTVLVVYDQFGNGKDRITYQQSFTNLKVVLGQILMNSEKEIYIGTFGPTEILLNKINLIGCDNDFKIIGCSIFSGRLYVLTSNEILVFNKIKE